MTRIRVRSYISFVILLSLLSLFGCDKTESNELESVRRDLQLAEFQLKAVRFQLADTQQSLISTQLEIDTTKATLTSPESQLTQCQDSLASTQLELDTTKATLTSTQSQLTQCLEKYQLDTVTVTEIVDGDTIKIFTQTGTTDTVRLLGVDTPETTGGNDSNEYDDRVSSCLDSFGLTAKEYTTQELEGKEIVLQYDDKAGERGYYDRLLAYVIIDGIDFNATLIAKGYARVYDESNFIRETEYTSLEVEAKNKQAGLWSCPLTDSPTPTPTDSPTPTPTDSPTPTPTDSPTPTPCDCTSNKYNCKDFGPQIEAQACYEYCYALRGYDVHDLDRDNDRKACEGNS